MDYLKGKTTFLNADMVYKLGEMGRLSDGICFLASPLSTQGSETAATLGIISRMCRRSLVILGYMPVCCV